MADFRKAEAASASQVDYSTTPEDLSTNEQNRIDQSLFSYGGIFCIVEADSWNQWLA